MRGLLLLCLAVLAVSSACGGEGGGSAPARESGSEATEAAIEFKKRVELDDVLAMCRRHGVRPTQLITWFSFANEEITSALVVQPGMSDAEITREFRQASVGAPGEMEGGLPLTDAQRTNIEEVNKQLRTGRLYVRRMLAAGTAEALQSLREEASVRSVFLKPDKPFGQ
jgi:hypothetical protein